uniref:Uncharacterized protein n=1 Tax=Cyanoptyche gloeocystis TaxID=77922 RepID=A0A7S2JM10_9EUKA|mmetsp:Transcript_1293/g.2469  ORF Transcript_1293/g.2469 Transcript_1293/m.2469 type:complete len:565 (+) Transcript_1293:231-1925(+)
MRQPALRQSRVTGHAVFPWFGRPRRAAFLGALLALLFLLIASTRLLLSSTPRPEYKSEPDRSASAPASGAGYLKHIDSIAKPPPTVATQHAPRSGAETESAPGPAALRKYSCRPFPLVTAPTNCSQGAHLGPAKTSVPPTALSPGCSIGAAQDWTPPLWSIESDPRLQLFKEATPATMRASLVRLGHFGPATARMCEMLANQSLPNAQAQVVVCFVGGSVCAYNDFPGRTVAALRRLYPKLAGRFVLEVAATPGCGPDYMSFCVEHHARRCDIAVLDENVNDVQSVNATSFERLVRKMVEYTRGAVMVYYHCGNEPGFLLRGNIDAQEKVSSHYNLPAVALWPVREAVPLDGRNKGLYYTDKVHPTPKLADLMGELVAALLVHYEKLVCPGLASLMAKYKDRKAELDEFLGLQTEKAPLHFGVPAKSSDTKCWTALGGEELRNFVPEKVEGDWFYHTDATTWSHGKWGFLSKVVNSTISFRIEGCPKFLVLFFVKGWSDDYGAADVYIDSIHVGLVEAQWEKPFTLASQIVFETATNGSFVLKVINRGMGKAKTFKVLGAACDS